jgi:hypothetical protein
MSELVDARAHQGPSSNFIVARPCLPEQETNEGAKGEVTPYTHMHNLPIEVLSLPRPVLVACVEGVGRSRSPSVVLLDSLDRDAQASAPRREGSAGDHHAATSAPARW